jgi:hypothetical protein
MTSRNAEEIQPSVIAGHHVLYEHAANHNLQGNVSPYGSAQVVFGAEEYFSRFWGGPTVIFSGDATEKRPVQCTRDGNQVSVAIALYGTPVDSVVVVNFQRSAAYLCFLSETLKTCTDRHL